MLWSRVPFCSYTSFGSAAVLLVLAFVVFFPLSFAILSLYFCFCCRWQDVVLVLYFIYVPAYAANRAYSHAHLK